jgi:hypothetical protein
MQQLMESADVGRVLGVTPAAVRALVKSGRLASAVCTPRGVRLFDAAVVERLRVERASRAARKTADRMA